MSTPCPHPVTELVNRHELIRKYKCHDCGDIVMCQCDEYAGRRLLSHQLTFTTDPVTAERIKITPIFAPNICATCRGLPEEPSPAAPHYGVTSKLRRYYWREIHIETWLRYSELIEKRGQDPSAIPNHKDPEYIQIEKEVIQKWSDVHETSPKYIYADGPPSAVIDECHVEVVDFEGTYIKGAGKDHPLFYEGERFTPEEFVAQKYKEQGWNVELFESIPFQALFGLLAWLWVQDSITDSKLEYCGFGGREGVEGEVWMLFPRDFGAPGYFTRREEAYKDHLRFIDTTRDDLLFLFDYWEEPSRKLRQYLWAYKDDDLRRARLLVEILPPETIVKIVTYLAEHYWERYLGWPDLFLWRGEEFLFVEVKGSKDKLSENQQHWIRDNHSILKLPFKLAKIHKANIIELP